MKDNKSDKSIFHDYAEEKVADDLKKNEALLKQRFILAHNISEMGQQLSKKGWQYGQQRLLQYHKMVIAL